jgi:hypothetical protein
MTSTKSVKPEIYHTLIDAAQDVVERTRGLTLPDDVNEALDRLFDALALDAQDSLQNVNA